MINYQGPLKLYWVLVWFVCLCEGIEQVLKASWYQQRRDWSVRITSTRLDCFPSWITKFLWDHMVQRVEKIACRQCIEVWSICLYLNKEIPIHSWVEVWFRLEVWIAKADPCQTGLANVYLRNKWEMDSSPSLHKGQLLSIGIPLLFKVSFVGRLSWSSLHTKL